ncbi:hypothetical protein Pan216_18600 [Planctomycetes bacterium Pan216]|uniref:Uncharacterized protein n=1 Tax=Kolteria novifilia TaxID=2527975 RepID=A0A518B203_9BACT|nr:hypothetical protein Pan216_18600 [Planctomycetes bacterium Pan216]
MTLSRTRPCLATGAIDGGRLRSPQGKGLYPPGDASHTMVA